MEDTDTPMDAQPEISISTEAQAATETTSEERRVADELKRLGQLLADTMRAAANTPEAENLRRELSEGAAALRNEIDETMDATRQTTTRVSKEYKTSGMTRLRADLAGALRALNRAVDSVASSVEPARGEDTEAPAMANAELSSTDTDEDMTF